MGQNRENQLELFDVQGSSTSSSHRKETWAGWSLHLRYDQLLLGSIASLIGLTVIFAFGVERGKQLVRSERVLLARLPSQDAQAPAATPMTLPERPVAAIPAKPVVAATPSTQQLLVPAQPVLSKPSSSPTLTSRYAIQVVTYSQPHLAKKELDRLQAIGERAFLVTRQGHTVVYVGPFPSKSNASQKLTQLKGRYQDCFLKTL